jgi:hypothetical protein
MCSSPAFQACAWSSAAGYRHFMPRAATQARCRNIHTPYRVGPPPISQKLKRIATPTATHCGTVVHILCLDQGALFSLSVWHIIAVAKLLIVHLYPRSSPPFRTARFCFTLHAHYINCLQSRLCSGPRHPENKPPVYIGKARKKDTGNNSSSFPDRTDIQKDVQRKQIASHCGRSCSGSSFQLRKLGDGGEGVVA